MADAPVSPVQKQESATTREEVDFDDDQETGTVSPLGHETPSKKPSPSPNRKSVSFQDVPNEDGPPPAQPPRPMSPQQQAEHTLIEAFPTIDTKVVKAVLMASGGKVEPAFNALLGMSDPSFVAEEAQPPPRQPPRPVHRQPMNQMEADEAYARQLAEQYNTEAPRSQTRYNQREPGRRGVNSRQQPYSDRHDDPDSPERNFFDDELPEIGRNIQQGFVETQKKFNNWFTNLKKTIDGEDEDEDLYSSSKPGSRANTGLSSGRQNFGPSQSEQLRGIRKMGDSGHQPRRSTEAARYDADPHELSADEFERLELRDDEAPPPMPPRTSSRQPPNPNLFKSSTPSGPIDEVDAAERAAAASGGGEEKSKKWQPLTSVAPAPEEDNDPFSLGDDDENEKGEDLRKEDSERLKEAARNSVSEGGSGSLEASEMSGTKNKEAEELLSGKKD